MKSKRLALYLVGLLFAFHWYLILYLNSSYLNEYFNERTLSTLYVVGAIISLVVFFFSPKLVGKMGVRSVTLGLIVLEALSVLGMAISHNGIIVGTLFISHSILMPVILFCFDIFLEYYTDEESITGGVRGNFLAISNIALVIAPFVMGMIISYQSVRNVYLYALLFLVPLAYIIRRSFINFKDKNTVHSFHGSLRSIIRNKNILSILLSHQLLQLYYAFMVIYMPIYLTQYVGFDWATAGTLLTIMLLPFVLFEIPAGRIADGKLGEKEMLVVGFIIMATATMCIYLLSGTTFIWWAIVLFMTRTGASLVEVMTETYFFKQVKGTDSGIISLFRITRPISFIAAPLIATCILAIGTFPMIFLVFACAMFVGVLPSLFIQDSR